MSERSTIRPFPRGALLGAAGLIALALISAATARVTGIGATHMPEGVTVESRDLRFDDRADGAVVVSDAQDDTTLEIAAAGTNGFLRGVLRGLARERKLQNVTADQPYRLMRWADGRLTLDDLSTRQRIDFGAFGPTNFAVFARYLHEGKVAR